MIVSAFLSISKEFSLRAAIQLSKGDQSSYVVIEDILSNSSRQRVDVRPHEVMLSEPEPCQDSEWTAGGCAIGSPAISTEFHLSIPQPQAQLTN